MRLWRGANQTNEVDEPRVDIYRDRGEDGLTFWERQALIEAGFVKQDRMRKARDERRTKWQPLLIQRRERLRGEG